MKVFISWSGPISREVAVALRDWLPSVIQAVEPYVSSEDIDPGVRWGVGIAGQLDDTEFGVLCVTRNNVTAPWLNFEAGALSKSVERSRVVPFLIDLSPSEIPRGPLAQFQAVRPTFVDMFRLVRGMNDLCGAVSPERLQEAVEVWWPRLEESLAVLRERTVTSVEGVRPQRSTDDMLGELLEITRGLQRELRAGDGPSSSPPLVYSSFDWERQVLVALHRITLERGFKWMDFSNSQDPTDVTPDIVLERADSRRYVEISRGRNPLAKVRRTIRLLRDRGILDPLLFVVSSPVNERFRAILPLAVEVVHWQGPEDDEKLMEALE